MPHGELDPMLSRDGQLLDLSIERHLAGELSPDEVRRIEAHLDDHPACRARYEAAAAHRREFAQRPLPAFLTDNQAPQAEVVELASRRPPTWWGAVALAAVAILVVMVSMGLPRDEPDQPDVVRIRGAGLELAVYTETGDRIAFGDPVLPGSRLGFQVRSREAGSLVILGIDDQGTDYLCYPQAGGSAPIAATDAPVSLSEAIRLDDGQGVERLVAVRCSEAVDVDAARARLATLRTETPIEASLPTLLEGCAQDEVLLIKEAR